MQTFDPAQAEFPGLWRRYLATAVDGLAIIGFFFAASSVLQGSPFVAYARASIVVIALLLYEPLFTSRWCTLGQRLLRVRVRSWQHGGHISLGRAYLRIILKGLMGWASFFSIGFTEGRRAVHDLGADSVVLTARTADLESSST